MVNLCFDRRLQAAAFHQIQEIMVPARSKIQLKFKKAGLCHHSRDINIRFRPERSFGIDLDQIHESQYIEAIEAFLASFLQLQFIGAWRRSSEDSTYSIEDCEREATLLVRRPATFDPTQIPGCFRLAEGHPWFRLDHRDRQEYCRICRNEVHDLEECPHLQCRPCPELHRTRDCISYR